MDQSQGCVAAPAESVERRILKNLGYFGHYIFVNRGGRGGKQHVLKTLLNAGGTMNQRQLLEHTSTSSASLSEVLGKLEAEGLVTRARCENDKRQQQIALTPEGTARANEVVRSKEEFEVESMNCLTPQEREELLALLDRIHDHWRSLDD